MCGELNQYDLVTNFAEFSLMWLMMATGNVLSARCAIDTATKYIRQSVIYSRTNSLQKNISRKKPHWLIPLNDVFTPNT